MFIFNFIPYAIIFDKHTIPSTRCTTYTQRRKSLLRLIPPWFIISYTVSEIMLPTQLVLPALRPPRRLPHLSTVFFSIRPLLKRRPLFRPRFMKRYFVQFQFSVRLDLLAPGWTCDRLLIPKVSAREHPVTVLRSTRDHFARNIAALLV